MKNIVVRTVRQLINTARMLIDSKELVIKDIDTGKLMILENVSTYKSEADSDETMYVFNCKQAGNGCMLFHQNEK